MEPILMDPSEVPLRALVRACAPGQSTPVEGPPLLPLLGGVPIRRKWYPSDAKGRVLGAGYEQILEGVRFTPVTTYSPNDAPRGERLALFIDGIRATYQKYPYEYVDLARLPDGTFISVSGYAYDHWLHRYPLPETAQLVAHGPCEYQASLDDAVVLPVLYRDGGVWEMLEEAGATFMRGTQWKPSDPEHFHVWLPAGWSLKVTRTIGSSSFTARSEVLIDHTGAVRASVTWATLSGRAAGEISLK